MPTLGRLLSGSMKGVGRAGELELERVLAAEGTHGPNRPFALSVSIAPHDRNADIHVRHRRIARSTAETRDQADVHCHLS